MNRVTRDWIEGALDTVLTFACVGIVVLLFVLFARAVNGAPVPAAPKELTTKMMTGRFDYAWGNWPDGTILFGADGTYSAQHQPGSALIYYGTWTIEDKGTSVVIQEWVYNADLGTVSGPQEYRFAFDVSKYPHLAGTSNGTTAVKLSNPKR